MKHNIKIILPILFSFFIMGFVDIVGVGTNYIKNDFNLSNSLAGILPLMIFIWFAFLSVPTSIFMNKIGRKNTVIISHIITLTGLLLPCISYHFISFLLAFSFLGIGNTMLQVALNPLIADITRPEKITSMLTLGQFIKAVSAFIAPVLTAWLSLQYGSWSYLLLIYSVFIFIISLWLYHTPIQEHASNMSRDRRNQFINLLSDKTLLQLFICILLIVGIDVGMNISVPAILRNRCNFMLERATIGASIYFAAKTIGTFLGSIILSRVATEKVFFGSMLCAIVSFGLLLFTGHSEWSIYCLTALTSMACANIFSIIYSLAIQYKPQNTNEISGLMIMGVAGGGIFPFIMGVLTDNWGFNAGLWVILSCIILITLTSIKFLISSHNTK